MSYTTIYQSSNDQPFRNRIISAVTQESWSNPDLSVTDYAEVVRFNNDEAAKMIWSVCVASGIEQAYEYALLQGNPQPGSDESVITDNMILATVQANWPMGAAPTVFSLK